MKFENQEEFFFVSVYKLIQEPQEFFDVFIISNFISKEILRSLVLIY